MRSMNIVAKKKIYLVTSVNENKTSIIEIFFITDNFNTLNKYFCDEK